MELYFKFLLTMGAGLIGMGLVLKILIDGLFNDWDLFGDLGALAKATYEGKALTLVERPEDVQLEIEKGKAASVRSSRLIDVKREQLRELDEVEHRLRLPNQPVVLTPLPPSSAELAEW